MTMARCVGVAKTSSSCTMCGWPPQSLKFSSCAQHALTALSMLTAVYQIKTQGSGSWAFIGNFEGDDSVCSRWATVLSNNFKLKGHGHSRGGGGGGGGARASRKTVFASMVSRGMYLMATFHASGSVDGQLH